MLNHAIFIADKLGNGQSVLTSMRTTDRKRRAVEKSRLQLLSPYGYRFSSMQFQGEQERPRTQRRVGGVDPRLTMETTGDYTPNAAHNPELKTAREVRNLARLVEDADKLGATAEATTCCGRPFNSTMLRYPRAHFQTVYTNSGTGGHCCASVLVNQQIFSIGKASRSSVSLPNFSVTPIGQRHTFGML